jgi:hypothetical protein
MVGLGVVLLLKSFCEFMKIFEMLITKGYVTVYLCRGCLFDIIRELK